MNAFKLLHSYFFKSFMVIVWMHRRNERGGGSAIHKRLFSQWCCHISTIAINDFYSQTLPLFTIAWSGLCAICSATLFEEKNISVSRSLTWLNTCVLLICGAPVITDVIVSRFLGSPVCPIVTSLFPPVGFTKSSTKLKFIHRKIILWNARCVQESCIEVWQRNGVKLHCTQVKFVCNSFAFICTI